MPARSTPTAICGSRSARSADTLSSGESPMVMTLFRRIALFAAIALALSAAHSIASAQEKLRVGKAVAESFAFIPLEVGLQHGLYKKHGLDIDITAFGGGARLQQ